ncbi:MAG: polysaccharide biosynthesis C-terminal domain-containing protein [Oscillospiraceae bacterium]
MLSTAGFVLMAIYLLLRDPLLTVFGGRVNDETFRLAQEYFFWITLGIPLYMFGQAMNPVIRADGSPRFAMLSTLAGAVVNIILDPVFLFVCKWGMMGAAVATVLGQALTAALAVWYLFHSRIVRLHPVDFCLRRPSGVPCSAAFVADPLVAAMAAAINMVRNTARSTRFFADVCPDPMAVVGIVMKFFPSSFPLSSAWRRAASRSSAYNGCGAQRPCPDAVPPPAAVRGAGRCGRPHSGGGIPTRPHRHFRCGK